MRQNWVTPLIILAQIVILFGQLFRIEIAYPISITILLLAIFINKERMK